MSLSLSISLSSSSHVLETDTKFWSITRAYTSRIVFAINDAGHVASVQGERARGQPSDAHTKSNVTVGLYEYTLTVNPPGSAILNQ